MLKIVMKGNIYASIPETNRNQWNGNNKKIKNVEKSATETSFVHDGTISDELWINQKEESKNTSPV